MPLKKFEAAQVSNGGWILSTHGQDGKLLDCAFTTPFDMLRYLSAELDPPKQMWLRPPELSEETRALIEKAQEIRQHIIKTTGIDNHELGKDPRRFDPQDQVKVEEDPVAEVEPILDESGVSSGAGIGTTSVDFKGTCVEDGERYVVPLVSNRDEPVPDSEPLPSTEPMLKQTRPSLNDKDPFSKAPKGAKDVFDHLKRCQEKLKQDEIQIEMRALAEKAKVPGGSINHIVSWLETAALVRVRKVGVGHAPFFTI